MKKAYMFLLVLFTVMLTAAQADVTLPANTTVIEAEAFKNTAISGVVAIPEGVTTIGAEAFYGCEGITELVLPSSVTRIESKAFAGCSALAGTVVLNYNCTVAEDAFDGCDRLTVGYQQATPVEYFSYEIMGGKVTITGFDKECNETDIIVPNSIDGYPVKEIGDQVFYDYASLTSLILPEGITRIGDAAIYWCVNLEYVFLPDSMVYIGDSNFYGCAKLESIILPKSLKYLGADVLTTCDSLTSIVIPGLVENIGYGFGTSSKNLARIVVEEGNTHYFVIDSALIDSTGCLISYPAGNPQKSYSIPDGVTSIGRLAFVDCDNLVRVTLPDGIRTIGDWAFDECTNLESIVLPDSLTSIGEWAFAFCENLKSIQIPNEITEIKRSTFFLCQALKNVILPNQLIHIGDGAFSSCYGLTNIKLPVGLKSVGEDAFGGCFYLESIIIPYTVEKIGYGLEGISDLVIYGDHGSYAEIYARQNDIDFKTTSEFGSGYVPIPDDLLQPDPAPKSEASKDIDRLIAFGQAAGSSGSTLNTFLNKMIVDHTTADVLAKITANSYTDGWGKIDQAIERIIINLTDPAEIFTEEGRDYGRRLFKEVAMNVMGGGKLPDLNAAAESNLINVAADVAEVTKGLDQLIFFSDVHLSKWTTYFNDFADNMGFIDMDAYGNIIVLDEIGYNDLKEVFQMRTEGDLNALNKHIDNMLAMWAENGKCVVDSGHNPRFAMDELGEMCPEGKTYALLEKMKRTASEAQDKVKKFGAIAETIGYIADAISIYSDIASEIQELDAVRENYTRNLQMLQAVCQHSTGDSKTVANELKSMLESDVRVSNSFSVIKRLAEYVLEKEIDLLVDTIDNILVEFGGTTVLGGIMAGGKIAGMVPLVKDAKELIDCQQLIIGWSSVRWELQGALESAMKASSPYTMYLADLYIEWHIKGLEIAKRYYEILTEHTLINNAEKVKDANTLITYINQEIVEWKEQYSYVLWNQHYYK